MSDVDGSTRIEKSENAGIIKASDVCGTVLDLEAVPEIVSGCICQTIRQVAYLGPIERWARASGVGDDKGVLREGAQDSTRIVEEFEGTVTGVGDGRCNLQVLQSIDVDVGGRGLEGQARDSGDRGHGGDEGDKGSAEGVREHRNLSGEG